MKPLFQRSPNSKYIPIEDVVDVNDESIWWFHIPNYNGYQVSTNGLVRSMKHFMSYPYGILIRPKKNRRGGNDPTYELTNNNNERTPIRLSQIQYLAKTNPYNTPPCRTLSTDISSRNMRAFIKNKLEVQPLDNTTTRFPKFTIIDEEDDTKHLVRHDVVEPIKFINGEDYNGRTDITTIFH